LRRRRKKKRISGSGDPMRKCEEIKEKYGREERERAIT
jgi:hypothetical protein